MGNHRHVNARKKPKQKEDIIGMVEGMAHAIKINVLCLPKSVYHYRKAIYAGFDGDTEPLVRAMARIKANDIHIVSLPGPEGALDRWKAGMSRSYQGSFYVVSMFYQLLTEYWRIANGGSKQVSKKHSGRHSGNTGSLLGFTRKDDGPNYKVRSRISI